MVWFRVDDNLCFHPKTLEAGNAAMGLWVRAGAWAAANLTDGHIPIKIANDLGSKRSQNALVSAGFWVKSCQGFQFHDWDQRQFSKTEVEQRRQYERDRKAQQRNRNVPPGQPPGLPSAPRARARSPALPRAGYVTSESPVGGPPAPPAYGASAITNCDICNEDGYRSNRTICDHIDHTETYRNGMTMGRAALTRKPQPL
jgi:hypothetical protein